MIKMTSDTKRITQQISTLKRVKKIEPPESAKSFGEFVERALGKERDNDKKSDFEEVELKSYTGSPIRLFTQAPPERNLWGTKLVQQFGSETDASKDVLRKNLRYKQKNDGFFLDIIRNRLAIKHEDHGGFAYYPNSLLQERVNEKLEKIILVEGNIYRDNTKYYSVDSAYLYSDFDYSVLELIRNNLAHVELRMVLDPSSESTTNKGTAITTSRGKLDEIYAESQVLVE